jgi:YbbR domain-containing protein
MNVREILSHNFGLKVLSLFLAMVLWLFVAAGTESETSLSLPVVFAHIPPGLVIINQPPTRVDVRLAGPRILLLRLHAERLPVVLDLQDAREGSTAFPGVDSAIHVPGGVRVTRVAPATIEVRLSRPDK